MASLNKVFLIGNLTRDPEIRYVSSGQPVTLEPMPANERRIVHLALAENPEVITRSIGEGEVRKVVISPRK